MATLLQERPLDLHTERQRRPVSKQTGQGVRAQLLPGQLTHCAVVRNLLLQDVQLRHSWTPCAQVIGPAVPASATKRRWHHHLAHRRLALAQRKAVALRPPMDCHALQILCVERTEPESAQQMWPLSPWRMRLAKPEVHATCFAMPAPGAAAVAFGAPGTALPVPRSRAGARVHVVSYA